MLLFDFLRTQDPAITHETAKVPGYGDAVPLRR